MKFALLFCYFCSLHYVFGNEQHVRDSSFPTVPDIIQRENSVETPIPVLKATTIIGLFNATFSWKIENLFLFDFGSRLSPNHLEGPTLSAVDRTNNNKVFAVTFSVIPEWTFHRIHSDYEDDEGENYELTKYKVSCEFSAPLPFKTEFHHFINSTKYDGQIIEKSNVDSLDSILEIILKAYYITKNEST